jgi:hypothetical protein
LHYSDVSDIIFIGFKNGSWELRHKYNPSIYLRKQSFDQNFGVVRKIAMNIENTALLSVSEDGTFLMHKFDMSSFVKGARGD